jgi:hypothetical protein
LCFNTRSRATTRARATRKRGDLGRPIGVTATVAVDNAYDPLHTVLRGAGRVFA